MEVKLDGIQNMAAEPSWIRQETNAAQRMTIPPVQQAGENASAKVKKDSSGPQQDAGGNGKKNAKEAKELTTEVQSYLKSLNIALDFQVKEDSDTFVVKVLNGETGEMIRQIPPEELLTLHEKLEELQGILFDKKV